jgi:hypothetical protein
MDGKSIENVDEIDVNDIVRILAGKIADLTVQNAVLTAQLKKALNASH